MLRDSDEMSLESDIMVAEEGVSANRPSEQDRADQKEQNTEYNVSAMSSFQYSQINH